MRIVFMGTPEFAVPSLEALLKSEHQVVGVVTQPDRPKGRGQTVTSPPVKMVAERAGIPLLQPLKIKTPDFFESLSAWKPGQCCCRRSWLSHRMIRQRRWRPGWRLSGGGSSLKQSNCSKTTG